MTVWRCRRKIEAFSGPVQWSGEITISHLSFFYEGYGEEYSWDRNGKLGIA